LIGTFDPVDAPLARQEVRSCEMVKWQTMGRAIADHRCTPASNHEERMQTSPFLRGFPLSQWFFAIFCRIVAEKA
jgi:hypothetical protein